MFRAKRLTADDHRRQQVHQPHALPIRQTAATTGEDCRGTRETGRNTPPLPKMQENLQEKEFPCALHTIMRTQTGGAAVLSCKIGVKMQDGSPRAMPNISGAHRLPSIKGGRFTIPKGKRKAPCAATLLPAPMFPSPAHQSALLTQVTGKLGVGGVVLKPGRKKETVKRPRSKNKNFGGRKRHICEGEVRPLCGGGARAAAWC